MRNELKDMSDKKIKALAKKANRWVASKKGRRKIEKALRRATETCRQLDKNRKISIKDWHRPMTI